MVCIVNPSDSGPSHDGIGYILQRLIWQHCPRRVTWTSSCLISLALSRSSNTAEIVHTEFIILHLCFSSCLFCKKTVWKATFSLVTCSLSFYQRSTVEVGAKVLCMLHFYTLGLTDICPVYFFVCLFVYLLSIIPFPITFKPQEIKPSYLACIYL